MVNDVFIVPLVLFVVFMVFPLIFITTFVVLVSVFPVSSWICAFIMVLPLVVVMFSGVIVVAFFSSMIVPCVCVRS